MIFPFNSVFKKQEGSSRRWSLNYIVLKCQQTFEGKDVTVIWNKQWRIDVSNIVVTGQNISMYNLSGP